MISKYGSTPRLQYGFGGTVNYKKFDFGVFFSGSALRSIMTNGIDPFQEGIAVGNRNVLKYIADNYWSEEKQNWDAKYPRLGLLATDVANNTVNSSYWLRNGSFLRLKNVEVGYKLPYGRISPLVRLTFGILNCLLGTVILCKKLSMSEFNFSSNLL